LTALCTNPLRLSPTEGDQLLTAGGETSFLKLFSLKPTEVVDGKKKALSLEEQLKDGEAAAAHRTALVQSIKERQRRSRASSSSSRPSIRPQKPLLSSAPLSSRQAKLLRVVSDSEAALRLYHSIIKDSFESLNSLCKQSS
jgi:hypothetical protein